MMRPLRLLPSVMVLTLLTACGGGGGGSSTPAAPPVVPTPTPTSPPAGAPPVPVGNSTAAARVLNEDGSTVYPAGATVTLAPSPPGAGAPIDGVPCTRSNPGAYHKHVHVTLYYNGAQVLLPVAIGIYHPSLVGGSANFYDGTQSDPASCVYDIHVHAAQGIVHLESANAAASFNLQQFLDIWGVTLTANGVAQYAGPTRVFVTDLDTGAAGSHPVTEVTGRALTSVTLAAHNEITIEVNSTIPTPNYTWATGL